MFVYISCRSVAPILKKNDDLGTTVPPLVKKKTAVYGAQKITKYQYTDLRVAVRLDYTP